LTDKDQEIDQMNDYSELEKAADAASKGGHHIYMNARDDGNWVANARFHTTCKPEDVLALIAENASMRKDAGRYQWLRSRDLDTIHPGGIFAGRTPDNLVINGEDLDAAIDAAMRKESPDV
jgi:hypothetical protein